MRDTERSCAQEPHRALYGIICTCVYVGCVCVCVCVHLTSRYLLNATLLFLHFDLFLGRPG